MVIVLITGVSGSGKSTVGRFLGKKMSWPFVDADDFHPPSNIEKMQSGIPLTDKDRMPWLAALNKVVKRWKKRSESGVLACSALKNHYRQMILGSSPSDYMGEGEGKGSSSREGQAANTDCLTVLLQGSKDLIRARMINREGHFMPDALLDSQFAILEELEASSAHLLIDIDRGVEEVTNDILMVLKKEYGVKVTIHSTV